VRPDASHRTIAESSSSPKPEIDLIFTFKLAFTLDTPYPSNVTKRSEQTKRQESGHFDTGQSNASVKNLDALLGSNCVVF
jgi:hypothetical protein